MDWIPIISQVKSLVQATVGDSAGAKRTQENFSQQCPVVSQLRSAGEAILYENGSERARKTQMVQLQFLFDISDGIPVVGHIKGGVHHACGDHEGGNRALKSSSRTSGVIIGGIGGFVVGGPVGAFGGSIAGGLAVDGVATGIESAVKGEYTIIH